MSHSKRNTSLAFFTSYERSLLRTAWGSQSTRLSRDSFLPFGSCQLCLLPSRDPVACASNGDIFCRECALNNLLAQRKEIKRLEKDMERRKMENEEQELREEEEARVRAVEEFEKLQMGLGANGGVGRQIGSKQAGKAVDKEDGRGANGDGESGEKRGQKRKFQLDEEELLRIAKDERSKARKALDDEKASSAKSLPSFWVPSQTPTSNHNDVSHSTKLTPICPASSEKAPHEYSLKTIITVHFTEEQDPSTSETKRVCPSCSKILSNASKAMLTKPCGHVLCKSCVQKFMSPLDPPDAYDPGGGTVGLRCYVCDTDLSGGKKVGKDGKSGKEKIKSGLVEINSEGTGFAGGGKNMVKKEGTAFQC